MGTIEDQLGTLAQLAGRWEGRGEGHYPTISAFTYQETLTFEHLGKPFLVYTQRTRDPGTGAGLHVESGYLRPGEGGRAELLVVQPTGYVEIHEGPLDAAGWLRLTMTSLARSTTAKEVAEVRREIEWSGGWLRYDLWMAHADVPLTHHLHAELRRVDD
ncbi:MAG: heme-binding beta-barrel domain-containing protein [Actinomycetes bacterium]